MANRCVGRYARDAVSAGAMPCSRAMNIAGVLVWRLQQLKQLLGTPPHVTRSIHDTNNCWILVFRATAVTATFDSDGIRSAEAKCGS